MAKKTKSKASTPKEIQPTGDDLTKTSRTADAGLASTKDGLQKTRSNSATRGEVRQQTVHRQGHPK